MRQILFLFVLCGLVTVGEIGRVARDAVNAVAERYMHLVLALGQHDPDYVDAFYGPAEWKTQAKKEKKSLDAIERRGCPSERDPMENSRRSNALPGRA
ncbi:MAG: hypothetical protein Udaeo2_07610 [Candidatus Udaeobacter sp.]|jgi:hypothetical protein|nr:MAG: hypothetical protein Udaeo2_07610 [Candidatus Udaeobacter sp.]